MEAEVFGHSRDMVIPDQRIAGARVRDMLPIESVDVALDRAINVLFGLNGAGKSRLIHALSLDPSVPGGATVEIHLHSPPGPLPRARGGRGAVAVPRWRVGHRTRCGGDARAGVGLGAAPDGCASTTRGRERPHREPHGDIREAATGAVRGWGRVGVGGMCTLVTRLHKVLPVIDRSGLSGRGR